MAWSWIRDLGFRIRSRSGKPAYDRRLATVWWCARYSLGRGLRDAVQLLRQRSLGVLIASIGTVTFDLAVLGGLLLAFGYSPPIDEPG